MSRGPFRLRALWGLALLLLILTPVWVAAQEERALEVNSLLLVSLVSPLDQDIVSGRVIFILSDLSPSITGVTVRLSADPVLRLSSPSWSGEWDSSQVPNGEYVFSFDACVGDRCVSDVQTIRVRVDNSLISPIPDSSSSGYRDTPVQPVDDVPDEKTFFLFSPSEFSLVQIHLPSQDAVLFRSSGDPLELREGEYDASIQFPSHIVSSVFIHGFDFSHDGQLASLSPVLQGGIISYRDVSYPISSAYSLSLGFSSEEVGVSLPAGSDRSLFYCTRFDFLSNVCQVTWSRSPVSDGSFSFSFTSPHVVLAFVPGIRDVPLPSFHDITFSSISGDAFFGRSGEETLGPVPALQSYSIPAGNHSVRLELTNFPFSTLRFVDVGVDKNGVFFSAQPLPLSLLPRASQIWSMGLNFSFSRSSLRLSPLSDSNIFSCAFFNNLSSLCESWVPFSSLSPGRNILAFLPRVDGSIPPNTVLDENLASIILDLQRLHTNKRFFNADNSLDHFPVLNTLFSDVEIDLECGSPLLDSISPSVADEVVIPFSPSNSIPSEFSDPSSLSFYTNGWEDFVPVQPEWRQREDVLSCDGVSLVHSFVSNGFPSDTNSTIFLGAARDSVKQSLTLTNETSSWQRRLINIRLVSPHSSLSSNTQSYFPSSIYSLVPSLIVFPDENNLLSSYFISDSVLRFSQNGGELGYYDLGDFLVNGFVPRTVVHQKGRESIIETLISVSLPPSSSVVLDPIYSLSTITNYSTRWNGGSASDQAGRSNNSVPLDSNQSDGPGIELVNVDNGAYSNDLLISSVRADINSKTDAGALYLIRNVDGDFGNADLALDTNYSVRWSGSMNSQFLGYPVEPGRGFWLDDIDGNGYSNDLLMVSPFADFNGQNSGSLYIIKDIDKKSGSFDLNNTANYDARIDGNTGVQLGSSQDADVGIQLVDIDNNGYRNDLLVTTALSNQGATARGMVSLFRDIGKLSGISSFGNLSFLGALTGDGIGGHAGGGLAVKVVNADGNSYANDLFIGSPRQGAGDDGALYFINDIDKRLGVKDLSSSSNYTAKWTGSVADDKLSLSGDRNSSFLVMDVDGNGVSNDLFIICGFCNRSRTDNGIVYLIKDFNQVSGDFNLTTTQNNCGTFLCWSAAWTTATNGDMIGYTNGSTNAVQIVNMDGNLTANDLILSVPFADTTLVDQGAVYVILDSNSKSGLQNLAVTTNYNARVHGGRVSDFISFVGYGGGGAQVINSDGNAYANDLVVGGSLIDAGSPNAGAVYLLRDIHLNQARSFDLNGDVNFNARWALSITNDFLGDSNNSGPAIQVVNLDNNVASNDLVLFSPMADVNGLVNTGGVWVVKDINTISGIKDLNSSSNYSAQYWVRRSGEFLGHTGFGGPGVRVVNLDGNATANDLLIADVNADYNSIDVGSIFIIRDVHLQSSENDLNNESAYFRRYVGGSAAEALTSTQQSGSGMFIADTDNDIFPDAFFIGVQGDANGKSDAGSIYRIEDLIPFTDAGVSFSFVLMLPSSGCTADQGSTSGGADCERAWISGSSTATQLEPEGQTAASSVPFFRYDNQSSTFSDFNIFVDLNAALPAAMVLKASNSGSGYQASCNGNPSNNCVSITSTKKSVGTAVYTAGSLDLNVYFWADYTAATGKADRNVNSAPGFQVV